MDAQKAYDRVWRNWLWTKLLGKKDQRTGVEGDEKKMTECARSAGCWTAPYRIMLISFFGVAQACTLSPSIQGKY